MTSIKLFTVDGESRKNNLKNYLDVEDLLDELGIQNIRESGGEIWASCPFHDDSGRHWSVNIDGDSNWWGVHSCFVCRESGRKAGNLVTLVRDLKNIFYDDALSYLESFSGISCDEKSLQEMSISRRVVCREKKLFKNSKDEDPDFLYSSMKNLEPNSKGWNYLINRGVTPAQIQSRGTKLGKGGYKGCYRNRVVFPIIMGGVVVNFYARSFNGHGNKGLYARKKGSISTSMFGFDKVDKLKNTCYVGEGAFDVLTMERLLGHSNIVGTGGSILYEEQVRFLNYFDTIIVVPDMKGKAASILPSCLKLLRRKKIKVSEPPKGYDIDDFGRKCPDGARYLLQNPAPARSARVTTVVNYTISR